MSIVLTINNGYSKITGLTQEQMRSLRKILSYKIDFASARYIPNPANRVKYVIDLKGNFATGLLDRVATWLIQNNIKIEVVTAISTTTALLTDNRAFKSSLDIKPYPDQINALQAVIERPRGILSLPTGSGKAHIIAMILVELKLKTLIIVPTLELKYQLTKSLDNSLTTMKNITVENIDSTALASCKDYDCLIIDEGHHVAAKTYHKLNKSAWAGIRNRYFLTATPFRNDTEETLLFESIAGSVIYTLKYVDAVKRGYIVPVEAYYYTLPKVQTEVVMYAQVYSSLIVNNALRNELIANIILKLHHADKFCLCLVKEVAHGQKLAELSGLPFANGADEDSRRYIKMFSEGKIKCLIGTEGLLGEGIDTKPCEYVIICGIGKAKSALMQKIGRGVRKYPGKESCKVIFFKDKSHKFTLTHWREECKIVKEEYNTEPIELESIK